MNVEQRIALDKFVPRDYQIRLWQAFEIEKYRKIIAVWPRRSGKDLFVINKILLPEALRNIGVYWYVWPTYAQGKKGFTDNITNDGTRMLDFIPRVLIASFNQQEQKIKLVNGSVIQIIGADNPDALVGANPRGCVFTEAALYKDARARQLILPILRNNKGWEVYVSTPRGKNHFYELWNIAQADTKNWFTQLLTIKDTQHISMEEIQKDIDQGIISEDLAQQEYFCSFDMGIAGSVYMHIVEKMHNEGRIGYVPYEPGLPVHTSWDLGINDPTVIIFFQVANNVIRVIDYYENNRQPIDHYVRYIKNQEYVYGKHIPPHDIAVEEMTSGLTRRERFLQLGVDFLPATFISIEDGIETVRATLPRMWIDKQRCGPLIKALENYRYEYDSRYNVYKSKPVHDSFSHAADCMRMLCQNLHQLQDGMTAQELDRRYADAMYGPRQPLMFDERYNRFRR